MWLDKFSGTDEAFYERHLLFDNVVDANDVTLRERYEAVARYVKVITTNGWFAARPSGTESIYKIYAESFKDRAHLHAILREAQNIVNIALEVRS